MPAGQAATIGLTDRIFTRVGAVDDIGRGQSTFLVEMHETARILHQATPRSLVILDEIGRGTSTFDGLSLAWAVAEHLHDLEGVGVKTLFATHYQELTELTRLKPRVRNLQVLVAESGERHRLSAPAGARGRVPELRHPGGAAGRGAPGGHRPGPGGPGEPGGRQPRPHGPPRLARPRRRLGRDESQMKLFEGGRLSLVGEGAKGRRAPTPSSQSLELSRTAGKSGQTPACQTLTGLGGGCGGRAGSSTPWPSPILQPRVAMAAPRRRRCMLVLSATTFCRWAVLG